MEIIYNEVNNLLRAERQGLVLESLVGNLVDHLPQAPPSLLSFGYDSKKKKDMRCTRRTLQFNTRTQLLISASALTHLPFDLASEDHNPPRDTVVSLLNYPVHICEREGGREAGVRVAIELNTKPPPEAKVG